VYQEEIVTRYSCWETSK